MHTPAGFSVFQGIPAQKILHGNGVYMAIEDYWTWWVGEGFVSSARTIDTI